MKAILIDTSTETGTLALTENGAIIDSIVFPAGVFSVTNMVFELEKLIEKAKISRKELSYIVAGRGPGSYTGIRVAASFAIGISEALQLPIIGVSSLTLFVPPNDYEGSFLSVVDARSGGLYIQRGTVEKGVVSFAKEAELVPHVDVKVSEATSLLVTPKKSWTHHCTLQNQVEEVLPSASFMAAEGYRLFMQGNFAIGAVSLLYPKKN